MAQQYVSARETREILYGRQALRECFRAGRRRIHALWIAAGVRPAGTAEEVVRLARAAEIPVRTCEKRALDQWTHSGNHQGLAAEADLFPYTPYEAWLDTLGGGPEPAFRLILDHLQDPQNVGSMLRTADAAGVEGVLLAEDRAVGITPAVVRASSGAAEHLSIARAPGLSSALGLLRRKGVAVYGLDNDAAAVPWTEAKMTGPVALVVGREGEGLTRSVRGQCEALLSLPMRGAVASLNAAVAAALAMFEVRRQRDAPSGGGAA
jgi:23S rRNA (guanosine2251-2'-O)-methyltransferase